MCPEDLRPHGAGQQPWIDHGDAGTALGLRCGLYDASGPLTRGAVPVEGGDERRPSARRRLPQSRAPVCGAGTHVVLDQVLLQDCQVTEGRTLIHQPCGGTFTLISDDGEHLLEHHRSRGQDPGQGCRIGPVAQRLGKGGSESIIEQRLGHGVILEHDLVGNSEGAEDEPDDDARAILPGCGEDQGGQSVLPRQGRDDACDLRAVLRNDPGVDIAQIASRSSSPYGRGQ